MRELSIRLDDLRPDFRKALLARNANEQTLALGWPIATGRKSGAPVVWPVGLLAADWRRTEDRLEIVIHANDVLVNPDWIKGAARSFGWTERGLRDVFLTPEGVGLTGEDFLGRLHEAAAGAVRGRVTGMPLASRLDPEAVGIIDIAGLFLPVDSTFTAGAVRDLDAIATWPAERLARTALAPALGLTHAQDIRALPAINIGPLNAEQIAAVRNACHAPLSVVTGPPGTGKSQAIVSMAASVLNAGGSVLVASKNHQALDAVEERLSGLAPDATFLVRTLDPAREVDRSLPDVFAELIAAVGKATRAPDDILLARLATLARQREIALDLGNERDALQCDIAELLDRIAVRERAAAQSAPEEGRRPEPRRSWLRRLLDRFRRAFFRPGGQTEQASPDAGATTEMLRTRLETARARLADLPLPQDAVALTQEIADLVRKALPLVLSRRASLSADDRQALIEDHDNLMLKGGNAPVPSHVARAVVAHRPLWLASVLGAPKRIPLEDGLFDLAIFDEASQCDIASAMPLLARAKRAVVVGDDRQLSFIQQLGVAHDRNLMQAQGLDPATMGRFAQSRLSLFDFAARIPGAPRVLLRDQYRSASDIVDYISGQFYGGQLRIASDPRAMKPPQGASPGIAWTNVAAPTVPAAGNVNAAETAAIAAHVRTLLVDQGYALLAADVAREWLREHPRARNSRRFADVEAFRRACRAFTAMLAELGVGVAAPGITPNYVLMQDRSYRSVFEAWQKLLRRDRILDDLWAWQAQTWTDFAALAIVLALDGLEETELVAQSPVLWRAEAVQGRWFDQDRPLAVFWLRETGRIVEVLSRPENPEKRQMLARAHVSLRISDPRDGDPPRRVVVWTPHAMQRLDLPDSANGARFRLDELQQAPGREILRDALILTPGHGAPEVFEARGRRTRVTAIALDASGASLGSGLRALAAYVRSDIYLGEA